MITNRQVWNVGPLTHDSSLATFWGDKPHHPMFTLKVQGVNLKELVQMLENFIGEQVIDCREKAEFRPEVISTAEKMSIYPISKQDASHPWFLGSK